MVWFVVDDAHVHSCGAHIHVHTQLSNPTWKVRGLCACECCNIANVGNSLRFKLSSAPLLMTSSQCVLVVHIAKMGSRHL